MNGNVDSAGLTKDLEWFSRVGIGGAQIFEGGMGARQFVADRVVYRSDEWFELFGQALTEAKARDIEISMATSAGWSVMGAPWVMPEDAMKKLVWSETSFDASRESLALRPLPSNDGPFQDAPAWGQQPKYQFAKDFRCLAVRDDGRFEPLIPVSVRFSRDHEGDPETLFDFSYSSWVSMPKDIEISDEVFCTLEYAEPVEVASATIGISGPNGFGAPELPAGFLEGSLDGERFELISELPRETSMGQLGEIAAKTVSFEPASYRYFRLRLRSIPMADALPKLMQGVSPLPFKPKDFDKFCISQFALFAGGKVHGFEYKAGFGIAAEYHELDIELAEQGALLPADIIDVTDYFDSESSVLSWQAPAGSWRIFRIGYSLTGHENGPAPEEATGLEVDKLDLGRIRGYLDSFFDPLIQSLADRGLSPDLIGGILSDSIESRAQNFTESLESEFLARRGYQMLPWLLALTGWVVSSRLESDRFLHDFRKTITELVSDGMYQLISEFSNKLGATYYSEALESHRPQLGDDLDMRSRADVPMGAMWTWSEGQLPQQTYLADLKGASSVAHVYGKKATGCESFSTYGKPFAFSPQSLKKVADLELALGVTLFNIHSSPHQPDQMPGPGMTLAPTLGQVFTRTETWAESSRGWVDYLSRGSYLLNLGRPVADILYYIGDEDPVTAIWGDKEFDVPLGFDFDLVSTPGLISQVRVDGGQLRSQQCSYKLLYLGGNSRRLSLTAVEGILKLLDAGAKVFGPELGSSPSLADDELRFQQALRRIQSHQNYSEVDSPTRAVELAGLSPDWKLVSGGRTLDSRLVPGAEVRCIHRAGEDFDLYFIANASSDERVIQAKLSASAPYRYLLDAVNGRISKEATRGDLELKLAGYGSVFVLLSENELEGVTGDSVAPPAHHREVERWTVRVGDFEFEAPGVVDWTSSDLPDQVRYFSGTAVLTSDLDAEVSTASRALLELPVFAEVVDVVVNGSFLGTIWAKGQRLDLTDALTSGTNKLELRVTNNWRNRLIGDQYGKENFPGATPTYIGYPIFESDAELLPSGLLAPAKIHLSF